MTQTVKIFIGGGGDAWVSRIVAGYAADYARLNPDYDCRYFGWTARRALRRHLARLPADAAITLVGHSYGADAAFVAVRARPVDVLISVDPVGHFKAAWTAVRPHCGLWLNVRAEPGADRRTRDDLIARLGGKYGRPPPPGAPGAPDHSLVVDRTHGAFRAMMRGAAGGISGTMLLGGNPVG